MDEEKRINCCNQWMDADGEKERERGKEKEREKKERERKKKLERNIKSKGWKSGVNGKYLL